MLIALLIVLSGCSTPKELPEIQQKLQFSVDASKNLGYTVIPQEDLGQHSGVSLAYSDLEEVTIRLDDGAVPLAEAIRSGDITIPELFAFARMDSQNSFCKETYKSEHGLTHFSYIYPECELQLTYDVLETPSGQQKLIEEVYIYPIVDHQRTVRHVYVDDTSEWGYFLDREDWGLQFEVSCVSPTQIVIDCTQTGGQQIGELFIEGFSLYFQNRQGIIGENHGFLGQSQTNIEGLPIPIAMNASGQITVDWSSAVGALDAGDYYIKLSISDKYDKSRVHSLMTNYYDRQSYNIVFTIS